MTTLESENTLMNELSSITDRIMESFTTAFSTVKGVPPVLPDELKKLLSDAKPKADAVVALFEKHSEEEIRDSA